MRSKIPRRAVTALQFNRSQPALVRPAQRYPGKIVANSVRAFMNTMFELRKTANIDGVAPIQLMALILSRGDGWRLTR